MQLFYLNEEQVNIIKNKMRMYDVLSRQGVSAFVQSCLTKQSTKALCRLLITCHTNSVTQVQNSVGLLCLLNFLNFALSNLILLLLLNNSVHFSPLQHKLISVYDSVRINAILVSSLVRFPLERSDQK